MGPVPSLPTPAPSDPDQLLAELAGCRAAHDRLLADLADLSDDEARRPSLLPDWTVGHVLTHLARNADGHVVVVEAILAGRGSPLYPGGPAQRTAGIEAGAGRPAAELVADLRRAADAVHNAWARLEPAHWQVGEALIVAQDVALPASYLPFSRWREVEVHHADLGLDSFFWADWSHDYIRAELPRLLDQLARRPDLVDDESARHLVAVLAGRADEPVRLPAVLS